MEEVEAAWQRVSGGGTLNTIVMNAVLDACAHCSDVDRALRLFEEMRGPRGHGVDGVSYVILLKGYVKSNIPLGALTVKDEILRQGLKPDRLTYNTIISACVKSVEMDKAIQFLEDMKGLRNSWDLYSAVKIVVEMKSSLLSIDRTAYTAMIDALLDCGSVDGALYIFSDIIKQAGNNKDLRPKPHLYLSIMRAFATRGDVDMVMRLNKRMWPDSVGSISHAGKEEAHELLMEAAINKNQVEMKPRMAL